MRITNTTHSVVKDKEEGDLDDRDEEATEEEDKSLDRAGSSKSCHVSLKLRFKENSLHSVRIYEELMNIKINTCLSFHRLYALHQKAWLF